EETHLRALRENANWDKRRRAQQERDALRAFDREAKAIEKLMRDKMKAAETEAAYLRRVRQNSMNLELQQERAHLAKMNAALREATTQQAQMRQAQANWANTRRDLSTQYDARMAGNRRSNVQGVSWDPRSGSFQPNRVPQNGYTRQPFTQRMGMNVGGYMSLGPLGGVGVTGPLGV